MSRVGELLRAKDRRRDNSKWILQQEVLLDGTYSSEEGLSGTEEE